MPGLVPGIHVFLNLRKRDVDGRDIGERSDAVLRTAMPGHDDVDATISTIRYSLFAFPLNPTRSPPPPRQPFRLVADESAEFGRRIGHHLGALLDNARSHALVAQHRDGRAMQ